MVATVRYGRQLRSRVWPLLRAFSNGQWVIINVHDWVSILISFWIFQSTHLNLRYISLVKIGITILIVLSYHSSNYILCWSSISTQHWRICLLVTAGTGYRGVQALICIFHVIQVSLLFYRGVINNGETRWRNTIYCQRGMGLPSYFWLILYVKVDSYPVILQWITDLVATKQCHIGNAKRLLSIQTAVIYSYISSSSWPFAISLFVTRQSGNGFGAIAPPAILVCGKVTLLCSVK